MPGIGKTTSIHCLAHALLGDAYKEGVMELNASDERYVYDLLLTHTVWICSAVEVADWAEVSMSSETKSKALLSVK